MSFSTWIDNAWDRHAEAPTVVAAEIADAGAALATSDGEVEAMMRLTHHVAGAHLGSAAQLAAGRALLQQLAAHAAAGDTARASAALFDRSLSLTGGDEDALVGLDTPGAIRVRALAASNLADRDAARAHALLAAAASGAEGTRLADADPAVRAVAVAGNNIAASLAERPRRDEAERALMMQAAELGLVFWRRAGTWLEEERAHHRLAACALAAGDAARARQHAQACLDIVAAQGEVALETFFGWEVMARVEASAGQQAALARAWRQLDAAFERLDEGDRSWCRDIRAQVGQLASAAREMG